MLFAKVTAAAALLLLVGGATAALPGSFVAAGGVLFLVAAVSAAVAMEERDATAVGGLAPSIAVELDAQEMAAPPVLAPTGAPADVAAA